MTSSDIEKLYNGMKELAESVNRQQLSDAVKHAEFSSDLKIVRKDMEKTKADVGEIKTHVEYTNGKVKANTLWRYTVIAGCSVFMATAMPLLIWFYYENLSRDKISETVSSAVKEQLTASSGIIQAMVDDSLEKYLSQYEEPQTN